MYNRVYSTLCGTVQVTQNSPYSLSTPGPYKATTNQADYLPAIPNNSHNSAATWSFRKLTASKHPLSKCELCLSISNLSYIEPILIKPALLDMALTECLQIKEQKHDITFAKI